MSEPSRQESASELDLNAIGQGQFRFGWGAIVIFMVGGLILESLHGFKVGWYLDVGNDTRRLMFQLAHAHGTLLGLTNIAFGASIGAINGRHLSRIDLASRALKFATILMPGGFFAGGLVIHGGDPGLGIIAVPIGAFAAILAAYLTWQAFKSASKRD